MAFDLYPAVDEDYNFAQVIRQALADSSELRNTVVPMTTVERNNLTGAKLWDGRLIVNVTTDLVERYDLATTTWVSISGASVYQGTDPPPSGIDYKVGDIYCQYE